ncbi:MAG: sulfatase-like hydrolase/transferase [Deltaproteobacteria bacterium]|nr:sulfatase-like hydrolase/transferase [Deltaproteobacteria bacterium]
MGQDAEPRSPAPLIAAAGFLAAKLVALGAVVGSAPLRALAAFCCGFAMDAALVLALALAAHLARRHRVTRVVVTTLAGALALYAVLNVYLVWAYSSPLTPAMLAYAKDADVALLAPTPLLATAGAALLAAASGLAAHRALAASTRRRGAGVVVGALLTVGLTAHALDDGRLAAFGLERNAVATLVAGTLPERTRGARAPWDAPSASPPARATAPVPVRAEHGRPRHVVLWLAESTAARFVSLTGGDARVTPVLESLREHTLTFTDYRANSPVSAKAIFSVLCGLFPLPEAQFETRALPRIACPSLPETLTAAGYDAALFHGGYFAFTDKLALLSERGFQVLMDGESAPDRERWFTNGWGIDDAAIVEHGLAWLSQREDPSRPSLAVYIPLLPHYEYFLPPGVPEPFGKRTLRERYQNGVHYTDELFGRVVEGYRAREIEDDTLFVFVGDHGEAFDEHPRNTLHGGFLYEENVRAPLVFYSPRLFPQAMVSERPGSHPDLAPTIFSLLGVALPNGLQGQSLVDERFVARPVPLGTWYPDALLGMVDGDWKYLRSPRSGAEQLFDLARDPGERSNVATAFPEVADALRARTLDWAERQRAHLRGMPARGDGYLERAHAALSAGSPGVEVALVNERVFNMERRCLRVRTKPAGAPLVLQGVLAPPPRTVGVGLTDQARFTKGEQVTARFAVDGTDEVSLTVDDRFESTSRVRALPAQPAAQASVRIEITSADARGRAACLWLFP